MMVSSAPLRRRPHEPSRGAWTAAVAAATVASGCAGGGRVELVSLDYRAIDPPAPRVHAIDLDRCYWWLDDDGRLWIAGERDERRLLGIPIDFHFQVSLALERLPAGAARNYVVTERVLRGLARLGPAEHRFTSRAGIVAVYREPGERLRVAARMQVTHEAATLLGGWSRARYVLLARASAVRDPRRGRAICESTESNGWHRDPTPTSQPADPQPALRRSATSAGHEDVRLRAGDRMRR